MPPRFRWIGLAAALLAPALSARAETLPTVYTIAMPDPPSHFFHVTARFEGVKGPFTFAFPAWTPGGYRIDEVAADVLDLSAVDGRGGPLAARKTDKQTWEIAPPPDGSVTVRYRVYANERGTPYAARLNGAMGHANLVRVLGYAPDRLRAPARVVFEPFGDWKLATSLEADSSDRRAFHAPDYDRLADGIVILGNWSEVSFDDGGAHYRYVFSQKPEFKKNDPMKDVHGIAHETAAVFGGVPFKDYLFLMILESEAGRGGIEHQFGTSMCLASDTFDDREKYLKFLGLTAHELVHAWNVKRLRPEGVGPYDYAKETYTHNLFVAEGFTTYYGPLASVRSGAVTREEFFKELAERIVTDRDNPGTLLKSLEAHSWDWWLKSNIPYLSYRTNYTRGSLVAWTLDVEIRRATKNARSLDDVMKGLFAQIAPRATGYTDAELRAAMVRWGAPGMDARLDALVTAPGPLDLAPTLAGLGLESAPDPESPAAVYTGWRTIGAGKEFPSIEWVEPGSPAAKAGLQDKDLLVALDGKRLAAERLDKDLAAVKPGATMVVTFFRDAALARAEITPAAPRPAKLLLRPRADADAASKAALQSWLAPRGKP